MKDRANRRPYRVLVSVMTIILFSLLIVVVYSLAQDTVSPQKLVLSKRSGQAASAEQKSQVCDPLMSYPGTHRGITAHLKPILPLRSDSGHGSRTH